MPRQLTPSLFAVVCSLLLPHDRFCKAHFGKVVWFSTFVAYIPVLEQGMDLWYAAKLEEYKQWNSLLKWNIELEYWTEFLNLYTMFYMVFVLLCTGCIYPGMS